MDIEIFKELGFTEREIKVYLALLELGSSTAGPIAVKSKLPHTKVYDTLGKLIEKGLVSYIIVSKTKHFEASDPKELMNILEERKKRLSETLKELELKKKHAKEKQIAIVHEGYKSFKALFNRISDELKKGDSYYAFAFKEDYRDESAPLFLRNFHQRLADKKVIDRVIANIEVKKEVKKAFEGNKNIKLKFTKRSTPMGIAILKNKVIQLTWGERPTAIEVTSSQIHKQYKDFFEELWKISKS